MTIQYEVPAVDVEQMLGFIKAERGKRVTLLTHLALEYTKRMMQRQQMQCVTYIWIVG